MEKRLTIDGIDVLVTRKNIKTVRLKVCPPDGQVRVSAPRRASDKYIRAMLQEKLPWIKKHQSQFLAQPPLEKLQFVSGETHYFFGEPLQLQVVETLGRPSVQLAQQTLCLSLKPGTPLKNRERLVYEWYRRALKRQIPGLIAKWQPIIGREVMDWGVKRMKTRWGTCNIIKRRIWLNLELAKKPPQCLEYILVHEMVHLLERYHNDRFYGYMDTFLPGWREYDKLLT